MDALNIDGSCQPDGYQSGQTVAFPVPALRVDRVGRRAADW
jgi:hypothetical protein